MKNKNNLLIVEMSSSALSVSASENKEYVQDILRRHKDKLLPLIQSDAVIYICGNTKMGQDV